MTEGHIKIEVKRYVDESIKNLEDKIIIVNDKNTQALARAEKEMDRRLEGMNEFRNQLDKQARTFVSRDDLTATNRLIDERINTLNEKHDTISRLVYIGLGIVVILQVILNVVIFYLKK